MAVLLERSGVGGVVVVLQTGTSIHVPTGAHFGPPTSPAALAGGRVALGSLWREVRRVCVFWPSIRRPSYLSTPGVPAGLYSGGLQRSNPSNARFSPRLCIGRDAQHSYHYPLPPGYSGPLLYLGKVTKESRLTTLFSVRLEDGFVTAHFTATATSTTVWWMFRPSTLSGVFVLQATYLRRLGALQKTLHESPFFKSHEVSASVKSLNSPPPPQCLDVSMYWRLCISV